MSPSIRTKNEAICALVVDFRGQYRSLAGGLHPFEMPASHIHWIAAKKMLLWSTSVKWPPVGGGSVSFLESLTFRYAVPMSATITWSAVSSVVRLSKNSPW